MPKTLHPTQYLFHHTLPHTMLLPLHPARYNAPSSTQCPIQCPCLHNLPHTVPLPSHLAPHNTPTFIPCPTPCPCPDTRLHTAPLPSHPALYYAPAFIPCPTQCPCLLALPHKTLFRSSLSFSLSKRPEQHCLLKWLQAHSSYGVSTGEFGFSPACAPRPASSQDSQPLFPQVPGFLSL